jgi:hypothetical protein
LYHDLFVDGFGVLVLVGVEVDADEAAAVVADGLVTPFTLQ